MQGSGFVPGSSVSNDENFSVFSDFKVSILGRGKVLLDAQRIQSQEK